MNTPRSGKASATSGRDEIKRRDVIGRRAMLAAAMLAPAAARAEAALDALLARHVTTHADGITRVRYAAWKASGADLAALDGWIAEAAARTPSRMARAEAFAHWANLYNALTLRVVLARHPVRSIRDIRSEGVPLDPRGWIGPWRTRLVTVEGRRLSLDDIEHEIMRPTFRDPRVHYAVNCAALGCPNLWPRAWQPASLDAALDAAARAFVNHPRGVRAHADGSLTVNSIYHWFREDFSGEEAGVLAHLAQHAAPPLAAVLARGARIAGHDYDWSLNDSAGAPG